MRPQRNRPRPGPGPFNHVNKSALCLGLRTSLVTLIAAVIAAVLLPGRAHAQSLRMGADKPPTFSVMQGFGLAYAPTATRLGIGAWEFGLLNAGSNRTSFGVVRVFRRGGIYSAVGPVIFGLQVLGPTFGGVFGAMGYELRIPLGFFLRAELNTEVGIDSSAQAASALLIGWAWR